MPRIGVDIKKLHAAFDVIQASGFLAEGKYTRLFEEAVYEWSGDRAAAVANCGSGLFAVLRLIKKRSGIAAVPVNTFFATGAMAREAGFQVLGVDCSKEDFSITADMLDKYAPVNTDVVILTHVGGGIAHDYAGVAEWCARHGAFLLEDAAHSLGVGDQNSLESFPAGTLGDAAVFSLYATKAVPIGEGGVVTSKDKGLIEAVRRFCNYGKYSKGGEVRYTGVGFNLRMWEWMAAVGYLQMERLPEIMERREEAAYQLSQLCAPMVTWPNTNWYKFIVPTRFPATRLAGKVYALSDQLTTSMNLPGVYPNAEWVAANHKCLPIDEGLYEGMSTAEIEKFLGV